MHRKEARWRCNRSSCRSERSARHNSIFAGSRLPLSKLRKILYFWASGTHVTEAAEHAGLGLKAGGQWYAYARDICTAEMLRRDKKIGGEGHTVEIDETNMKKKQKYNRGSKYPDFWCFGGVDRTTKLFAKVVYYDRTKPNLSRAIKSYIKSGTQNMSDQFNSYVTEVQRGRRKGHLYTLENNKMLAGMQYTHQWVNHSQTFVDPTTGACTNRIEGVWEVKIKARVKSERGMMKTKLPSFLDEWLWRSWYFDQRKRTRGSAFFNGLVLGIRRKYKV
ncbi:hypothetical protein PHMEG_00020667 [Phytophthora megakarya]|uniref:ISXO2-like transposase domain-containing protein n=1 Tax=Phytophthora megakarya TaxID=4795 RepID=A0A225VPQ0_9STRA|nr:hypothetical protein PHMEG_00020667 [Phytophthora megakarya]